MLSGVERPAAKPGIFHPRIITLYDGFATGMRGAAKAVICAGT
jgi:hypothetical protein